MVMFRIGEFSRLVQLSVRVLRHYDEIGVLVPASVDPGSGYRYYTPAQLADAQRVVALKELGLSLEQIQRLTHERLGTDEVIGMLRLEQARAEQARTEAERRLRRLDERLAELRDTGTMSDIDVVEKSVPAMAFLAYRATVADLAAAESLFAEVRRAGAGLRQRPPVLAVAHDTFFDTEHLDIEIGFPVAEPATLTLASGRILARHDLPAVDRMLSIVAIGAHEDGHLRCHLTIGLWLAHHGCHLAGPGREIIHDDGTGATPTVEIQYPVATGQVPDRAGEQPFDDGRR